MYKLTSLALLAITPFALFGHAHDATQAAHDEINESVTAGKAPFRVVAGWGTSEGGVNAPDIGSTHGGIVVDKKGEIYVSTQRGIFVFNSEGELLRSIEGRDYMDIHAMVLNVEDGVEYIYGARNKRVEAIKMKTDGEIVLRVKFPQESGVEGKFKPTAVAVKPNGHILIADGYGSHMIFEFDPEGKYLSHFGGKDVEQIDKFKTPHGLTIDDRYDPARLLIADREKMRLVHFTLEGEFIGEVITGLRRPCAVSIRDGQVAIAELQGRVAFLDADNKLVSVMGDNPNRKQWAKYKVPEEEWQEGVFTAPHGISWDHEGNLYVQDWSVFGRVTKWEW